ncbi:hypothetical protein BJ875DRAFT_440086 [Amylocarpus encephaloides]|uniref:Uncharacterized protein n=1 Tax=Amylocarpus encephaloides TaxID=45428 RepID=A0A9P8C6I5_9HELO|nr:hypothetical protein BJ875DRAFT_440086 [Amylocarpus encephaloides]
MHDDIVSILDISKLRLIESAYEGSYTKLSKAANTVIAALEFSTVNRRNIKEWLGDAKGMSEDGDGDATAGPRSHETLSPGAESSTQALLFESIPGLGNNYGCIYFILTGQCRGDASHSPCQLSELGKDCAERDNSILNPQIPSCWSIGKRIADTLNPDRFTGVDLDDLMRKSDFELTDQQKLALPVAKVYLYCAPCACLLATAFNICREAGSRAMTYFEFLVRPDDRLVLSCCSQKDRSLGLASLIEKVREIEGSPSLIAEMGGRVLSSHYSEERTAGIVILGELGYCLPIMRSPPFASKARIPKETEIFQMKKIVVNGKFTGNWVRQFLGTYTPKAGPVIAPGTPQSTQTLPSTPLFSTPVASKPPPRQISPPPNPDFKRQKSSQARSVTGEEAHP